MLLQAEQCVTISTYRCHTAGKWQSQDLNAGCLTPSPVSYHYPTTTFQGKPSPKAARTKVLFQHPAFEGNSSYLEREKRHSLLWEYCAFRKLYAFSCVEGWWRVSPLRPRAQSSDLTTRTRPGSKWGDQQSRFPFLKRDAKLVRKKPRVHVLLLTCPNQKPFLWHTVLFSSLERYYVLFIERCVLFEKYNVPYKCRAVVSLLSSWLFLQGKKRRGGGPRFLPQPVPPAASANWSAGCLCTVSIEESDQKYCLRTSRITQAEWFKKKSMVLKIADRRSQNNVLMGKRGLDDVLYCKKWSVFKMSI